MGKKSDGNFLPEQWMRHLFKLPLLVWPDDRSPGFFIHGNGSACDRVKIDKIGNGRAPRKFGDYASSFAIDRDNLPKGIRVIELPDEMDQLEQLGA